MITIPFGNALGGCITPAGSALNVLCINVLRAETGINIPFLHWFAICTPIIMITLPITYFFLIKIFKPEDIKASTLKTISDQMGKIGPLEALDKKVAAIILLTIAAWVISTWTGWDLTAIAVACTVAFFLPGIDALTWQEFSDAIAWPIVFLIGSVQSIAGGMVKSGAAAWIISSSLARIALGSGALIAGAAFMLPLIRLIIPVGPPVIFIALIPLAGMAEAVGVSAVVFTIIISFAASVNLLLAIDANALITYSRGWYTMGEYFIAGIAPTLTFILCHIFLLPTLVRLVGL
jgi:sodium-dependent dicarboxylate transporter 2/3/5